MNTPASEITLLVTLKPSLVDPLLTLFAVPYGSIDNGAGCFDSVEDIDGGELSSRAKGLGEQ
jgi:hypothetical protein